MTQTLPATAGAGERPIVLALVHDRSAIARLVEALRPGLPAAARSARTGTHGATLQCVGRVAELRAALDAHPCALVVIEPRDADDAPTDEAIRALRAGHPAMPVIGYVAVQRGMSADLLALARAGVHELVVAGVDDVALVLRAALARAGRRATADRVLAELSAIVPAPALPVLRYCLEHTSSAPDVPALARALGVTRQTLGARLRAAGLPGPHALAVWCRLLLAAELLRAEGGTLERVTTTLDFASANSFRNLLRRYADLAPADLRRDDGAALRQAFRDALAGRRPAPRDASEPTSPRPVLVPS